MSGDRFLLDTNAIVRLLDGTGGLDKILRSANWIGISIISRLEFLAYRGLSREDALLFFGFCERVETVDLAADDHELVTGIVRLRRDHGLKLPDSIIAATALAKGAALVTADQGFERIPSLKVVAPSAV